MRRPPPLGALPAFPIVGGTAVLSVALSLLYWSGRDVTPFLMEGWRQEPWRLFTSTLLHGDALHLLFNLYWLWVLGSLVEQEWGTPQALATVLLFGGASGAAQYAFSGGGIGLSGVNYGFVGLLWELGRRDPRFLGAMDRRLLYFFLFWFGLCIVLTSAGAWNIANVAHGAGFLLGILLGRAASERPERRPVYAGLLGLTVALILAGATIARPYLVGQLPWL
ncbi:MAG: rhomboid family intramembrane serine protease [bacterium]